MWIEHDEKHMVMLYDIIINFRSIEARLNTLKFKVEKLDDLDLIFSN